MKTEGPSADFAKWIIELRDGAFQIQREFPFEADADLEGFVKFVGNYMKCPNMTVTTARLAARLKPTARVRIQLLPERTLLKAAGEIAAICEHEYGLILSQDVQTAA
jgi:hypothetical protein